MTPRHRRAATTALALISALALAACASHPKPTPPAATAPPPPPQAPPPETPPPPPVSEAPTGPIPGSVQDFVIHAGDRVYFDLNEYNVRPDARGILDAQSAWLQRYPEVRVRVEGNCDDRGTEEYNFALGARRAAAVKDYLVSHGVPAARIDTVSYGKEHPIAIGNTEDDYAKNRNAHTDITSGARS
ncbi:MAG TPA: peptidoglycan-associated lipoprotein Pal [Caulobacteraceae bacterium]|nr:peptidoglycan-associated lipoprotein Pal [Caulobacteraceae bacterium]